MENEKEDVEMAGYPGFKMSPAIEKLAAALAAAQAEMEPAVKGKANPAFKSKYADLDACWKSMRGPLAKHGLSLAQMPSAEGQIVTVTTLLMHTSGQWLLSRLTVRATASDPQKIGTAITYARRYALGIVGVTADEDDDANSHSNDPKIRDHSNVTAPKGKDPKAWVPAPQGKDPKAWVPAPRPPAESLPPEPPFNRNAPQDVKRMTDWLEQKNAGNLLEDMLSRFHGAPMPLNGAQLSEVLKEIVGEG